MVEQSNYKVHFVLHDGTRVIVEKEIAEKSQLVCAAIEEDPECEDHEDEGEENRRWDVPLKRNPTAEEKSPQ